MDVGVCVLLGNVGSTRLKSHPWKGPDEKIDCTHDASVPGMLSPSPQSRSLGAKANSMCNPEDADGDKVFAARCEVCRKEFHEHDSEPDPCKVAALRGADKFKCFYHARCFCLRDRLETYDIVGDRKRCDACGFGFADTLCGLANDRITVLKGASKLEAYFHEGCWSHRDERCSYELSDSSTRCIVCALVCSPDDPQTLMATNKWKKALTNSPQTTSFVHRQCWRDCSRKVRDRYELSDEMLFCRRQKQAA